MPIKRGPVLATLLLCAFAVNVDVTLVNVTLPTLVRELGTSTRELQWVVDAYTLTFASLVLAAGTLSDRLGRREVLLAGLAVYAVGNLAAAFAGTAGALIATRAVMGLGAALIFPSTLSIITDVFTERGARARAIGAWGGVTGLAVALGPIVGGAALEAFDWHAAFWIKVPIALLAAVAVVRLVPSSRGATARRLDVPGVLLTVVGVAALVDAIIEAPDRGWTAPRTLLLGLVALVAAAAWARWERRTSDPMFDLALLRDPRFTAAAGAITVAFFALAGFTFLITQFFQVLKGYGPLEAGVRLLPVALSVGTASVLGTVLAVRAGPRAVIVAGLGCLTIAYAWISSGDASTHYGTIVGQMLFLGTGMGLTSAPATDSLMGVASTARAGVASAVNDTTRELGSTLGVAVIGSVFASLYGSTLDTSGLRGLPPGVLAGAQDSVGAAVGAAGELQAAGAAGAADRLRAAAFDAFTSGLQAGCLVAAGVCLTGAVVVWFALRTRRPVPAPVTASVTMAR